MSSSVAELTLVMKARNLADQAIAELHTGLDSVGAKAEAAASRFTRAFLTIGSQLTNILGNAVQGALSGQGLDQIVAQSGIMLAGVLVEQFGASLLEKLAGSAFVAAIAGGLATVGSTIGGLIAAAIPVGMAAWPVLLVGAIAAGIVFLINNPDVVAKIASFAAGLVHGIIEGVQKLPGLLLDVVLAAGKLMIQATIGIVGTIATWWLSLPLKLVGLGADIVRTIVGGLVSLPGKIADVVRQAFANLKIDVGPFHISASGVRIDLPTLQDPKYSGTSSYDYHLTHHAGGGWAGLHGPELSWLGEKGPEYVISNDALRGGGGMAGTAVRLVGISREQLDDLIDRSIYFQIQRASPSRVD
jgi:hypothetical protein